VVITLPVNEKLEADGEQMGLGLSFARQVDVVTVQLLDTGSR